MFFFFKLLARIAYGEDAVGKLDEQQARQKPRTRPKPQKRRKK